MLHTKQWKLNIKQQDTHIKQHTRTGAIATTTATTTETPTETNTVTTKVITRRLSLSVYGWI